MSSFRRDLHIPGKKQQLRGTMSVSGAGMAGVKSEACRAGGCLRSTNSRIWILEGPLAKFTHLSIADNSHTLSKLSLALFALQLQSLQRILQPLFLLLHALHLEHFVVAESGCLRQPATSHRLRSTSKAGASSVAVQSSF